MENWKPGTTIGRYQLVAPIGRRADASRESRRLIDAAPDFPAS